METLVLIFIVLMVSSTIIIVMLHLVQHALSFVIAHCQKATVGRKVGTGDIVQGCFGCGPISKDGRGGNMDQFERISFHKPVHGHYITIVIESNRINSSRQVQEWVEKGGWRFEC